jgi:signal transduction histidine kinase
VNQNLSRDPAGNHAVRRTVGFFGVGSTALVVLLGLGFVTVVAVADYLVRPEISFAPLYLLPIALVTWNLGRAWGVTLVILSTMVGLAGDLATSSADDLTPLWNGLGKFAVFMAFSLLLATLKSILKEQTAQVEKESLVSDGLRQLNDVKDTLLHAVSHDLKSPLSGILGAMQTIRRDEEIHLTPSEIESLYEVIEQSGKKMNRLIDDMLDLERIDSGSLQPNRKATDVGELARRVVQESRDLQGRPIRIDADHVKVDVDPGKVERIIDNLLLNAARHTPGGTAVYVKVQEMPNGVVLIVEDEGDGVPDELKDVLFEPFRQGEGATGGGMGIGLSLVRRFAQLHGGSAVIEDREGGGARFVVRLPGVVHGKREAAEAPHLRAV